MGEKEGHEHRSSLKGAIGKKKFLRTHDTGRSASSAADVLEGLNSLGGSLSLGQAEVRKPSIFMLRAQARNGQG